MKYSKYIINALLLLVIAMLSFKQGEIIKVNDNNVLAYQDSLKVYKDKLGRSVYEKRALIVDNNQLKYFNDSLKIAIKNVKPVTITKIKTKIVYKDTAIVRWKTKEVIKHKFSLLFQKQDKYISVDGLATNEGIKFDNIELDADLSCVVGYRRKNIFSKPYPIAKITSNNPYIKSANVESFIVKKKKTIFERKGFWILIGAGAVIGIQNL